MAPLRSLIRKLDDPSHDPVPTEHEEQVLFCKEFSLRYPDLRFFAIPNGGKRSKKTAIDLKAEGVAPGVPDIFIPAKGLWVEMKRRKGGSLSPVQKDWIDYLQSIGQRVVVGFGAYDALAKIEQVINEQARTAK